MKTCGVKLVQPELMDAQIDWLIVPLNECCTAESETIFINQHFRKPHEPWGASRAFVSPVTVRRSRRRVLFSQQSGLE